MIDSFLATMTVLQYGDSFFPSGSVSFSWGLESLVDSGSVGKPESFQSFLVGQLHTRWGQFDRPILSASHRASPNLKTVACVDELAEIQTPAAEFRSSSRRMGEAMLSVFARLGAETAISYRQMIRNNEAYGHQAAMQGFLWAQAGLTELDTMALSAHTLCVNLLGAGIRLGCISHIDAQRMLIEARRAVHAIVKTPAPSLDSIGSAAIEAEIAVMRHRANKTRMFAN